MKTFIHPLNKLSEFQTIKKKLLDHQGLLSISGCIDSQKSHLIYGLSDGFSHKIIATYSELKAKEIYEDYKFFDREVMLYPAKDLIFYSADVQGSLITKQRISVIKSILENEKVTVITTLDGMMDQLASLETIASHVIPIQTGGVIDVENLKKRLVEMGYERGAQVEFSGQFAIRGGIIDVFPLTEDNPYRIELWDEEVDSIRSFDVESQRSIENIQEIRIYPAMEMILDGQRREDGIKKIEAETERQIAVLKQDGRREEAYRIQGLVAQTKEQLMEGTTAVGIESFLHYFYSETVSFLDYFPENKTLLFLDEPNRLKEKGETIENEFRESMSQRLEKGYLLPGQTEILHSLGSVLNKINQRNCVSISTMEPQAGNWDIREKYNLDVKSISPYNNHFELLAEDLKKWKKRGYQAILLCGSRTRAKRLAEDLREYELRSFYSEDLDRVIEPGEIMVTYGSVHRGYEYPLIKFAVLSEGDIFGKGQKKKKRKIYEGEKISNFSDLSIGDYVVHENHGLGIYKGIEKVEVDHVVKDYIKIEYAAGGNLYILATQLNMIQKFAGSDAKKPKLNKLGTQEWSRTKARVKGAVKQIAGELVTLYAARQAQNGYRYGEDTIWQREFEEMFPYEETEDQLLAIEAAKRDMESRKIMDRLICGDVGYGKTEVAIRAAFKAVQESKQVVYLVPTTILAQQHYNTFVQRMKDFPVRVDLLCRFRTPTEQKKTLQDLKKGLVDIVIGTHRVLSKDVQFRDLGLLIIDEEQRFGVTHKEKIKQLRENIDVLTLTATPIPRTLHMSLIGIRDMSVLEEPPMDRVPIQTYVMEHNEEMIREAINRELARNGQVYYVYNRVNDISEVAAAIAKLVPDATVGFAHGQMREHDLERIMYDFINGDIDVLVSTTIIETGLDISNVNTMIIHDADNLGLSQLYQLRGRIGRSNRTSYAFLMYRRNKILKEVAEKRLHAIREFTELGSGFKIAMRDLEIRGAGNLLGAEQHGHMQTVGYDLYCKMLNEAVKQAKGISTEDRFDTTIDLDVDAFIPDTYIKNEYQKLDIYKRIAAIENEEEGEAMFDELLDRFGEPVRAVMNLIQIAVLKAFAHSMYVTEISQKEDKIIFRMYEQAKVNPAKIQDLIKASGQTLTFTPDTAPYFTYQKRNTRKETRSILTLVKDILDLFEIIKLKETEGDAK